MAAISCHMNPVATGEPADPRSGSTTAKHARPAVISDGRWMAEWISEWIGEKGISPCTVCWPQNGKANLK